jgi:hypothetical protein
MDMEKEIKNITTHSSSLGVHPHKNCPPVDNLSVVFKIPLRDGSFVPIKKFQLDQWRMLYPEIDVVGEIDDLITWYKKNPKGRPTKNNYIDKLMNRIKTAYPKKNVQIENEEASNVVPFNKEFVEGKLRKAI